MNMIDLCNDTVFMTFMYVYTGGGGGGGAGGGCRYFFDGTYGDFSKIPILPPTSSAN